MLGFLVMGLRFLGVGTPVTASLISAPAKLPLFFGGALRANDPSFYSPSALEWLSSMGVIALAVMGFSLGWLLLPLQEEHPSEPSTTPPSPFHYESSYKSSYKSGNGEMGTRTNGESL